MDKKKVSQKSKKPIAKSQTKLRKPVKKAVKKTAVKTVKPKKKVLAIPKGYHSITPYLIVNNAAKALDFYKKAFGAKELVRMEQTPGKIGHAEVKIGDSMVMLADEYPDMKAHSPKSYGGSPVSIHLYTRSVDDVVKKALAAGAKLIRPVEDMFYGDRCGGVEDPFGHHWYIATHIENLTKTQIKKRAAEFFGKQSEKS